MIDKQRLTLHQAFQQLPRKIVEWLASEEVTYMIIDLNRRLGLEGVFIEVIPHLITRLAVRDLDPKKFIDELSDGADLDQPIAQGAAEEIERRILRPVEVPLRNEVGVDIKAIFLAKPPAPPAPPTPPIYRPTTPIPLPPVPTSGGVGTPTNSVGAASKEIPVKINIQKPPVDPPRLGEAGQPFGADSWVNKLK